MQFDHFIKYACSARGLNWRKYRRASRKRVQQRILSLGLRGYGDYLSYLDNHPQEAAELPNLLRVTVTRFFRDQSCWQQLAKQILPGLLSQSKDRTLKTMCIGSCGGEEPYSLALTWTEYIRPRFPHRKIMLTAVEMDTASLERSRKAEYKEKTLREVPQEIKDKWFAPVKGGYMVKQEIKDMVDFKQLDFLKDVLPGNQDLLLCRNLVFTYFQDGRLRAACKKLEQVLNQDGILMIGQKESLGSEGEEFFRLLAENFCFYEKRVKFGI